MDSPTILTTLVGLTIALAVFAGATAARLLLHAADAQRPSDGNGRDHR